MSYEKAVEIWAACFFALMGIIIIVVGFIYQPIALIIVITLFSLLFLPPYVIKFVYNWWYKVSK